MIISLVFITLSYIFSKKILKNREKETPFECGFDPLGVPRLPFSSRFFLIAVLFLVFDVEIVLLFPLIVRIKLAVIFPYMLLLAGGGFLIILLIGLFYEWKQGVLKWAWNWSFLKFITCIYKKPLAANFKSLYILLVKAKRGKRFIVNE